MRRSALVLAAHGAHADASVNAQVHAYRDSIARLGHFSEVAVAFHQGEPTFATVLDGLAESLVTVVPVMTSEGYYSDVVLPRELRRNRRFREIELHQTAPVGTHTAITKIVLERIGELTRAQGLSAGGHTIAIVGHGTRRHVASRDATIDLVTRLERCDPSNEFLTAFLDDDPPVETILARARSRWVVVLPFLIGSGAHATRDIPRRLGMDVAEGASPSAGASPSVGASLFVGVSWPVSSTIGEHSVICDRPIGADPGLVELIVDLAGAAREYVREAG